VYGNVTIQPLREGMMYAYKLKFKEKFFRRAAWKEFNNLVYDRTMFTHAVDHNKWHEDTIKINIIVLTAIREYACPRPALRVPDAKYMEKVLYEDDLVVNNKLQFETSVEKNEDHVAFILTRKWLYNVDFNEWKRRYGPLDEEILNELKYLRGVNGHLTRDKLPKAYISRDDAVCWCGDECRRPKAGKSILEAVLYENEMKRVRWNELKYT
jgi:hypothetical protein